MLGAYSILPLSGGSNETQDLLSRVQYPIPSPTRSDTNQAVQSHRMVRGWKFWIEKVEELYYPSSENKADDQLRSIAKLICAFVFAYADCWFPLAAAYK